ncbi:MAG: hypothetical protein H6510_06645 [Acidobacteria bacterium]|nr:hypothetical protein [Acidobacteriota bacterium]MCB9397473.1 hypothetical protein [Acidobacteriota bacterium]
MRNILYVPQLFMNWKSGISSDTLILHGTDATASLRDHWPIDSGDSNWVPQLDRDGSGRISVLDLLIQMVNPVCL